MCFVVLFSKWGCLELNSQYKTCSRSSGLSLENLGKTPMLGPFKNNFKHLKLFKLSQQFRWFYTLSFFRETVRYDVFFSAGRCFGCYEPLQAQRPSFTGVFNFRLSRRYLGHWKKIYSKFTLKIVVAASHTPLSLVSVSQKVQKMITDAPFFCEAR